jgi:hypothetical protein
MHNEVLYLCLKFDVNDDSPKVQAHVNLNQKLRSGVIRASIG